MKGYQTGGDLIPEQYVLNTKCNLSVVFRMSLLLLLLLFICSVSGYQTGGDLIPEQYVLNTKCNLSVVFRMSLLLRLLLFICSVSGYQTGGDLIPEQYVLNTKCNLSVVFRMSLLLRLLLFICSVSGRKGFLDWNQEYGYVDVRTGAHTFYWMFYANNASTIEEAVNAPLVIWLQGGPGGGSTGYGNFYEMVPYFENFTERSSTWAKYVNLLFIDNPVGTGFSYVDYHEYLTTNNTQIAVDLVTFTKAFYSLFPQFNSTPLYIFSESYGGKMATEFAWWLNKAIVAGEVTVNLSGVALGDSWISPVETCLSWAPYLLNAGLIDDSGYNAINALALKTKKAVDDSRYLDGTALWGELEGEIEFETSDVDFYNISKRFGLDSFKALTGEDEIMNGPVREALNITKDAVYDSMAGLVFDYLWLDFMKPVTDIVAKLLNETNLSVVVYSGQLDLIVDTPGTLTWVNKLTWSGIKNWIAAPRNPLLVNYTVEGYTKKYGKFAFYWIDRAGHMSPTDNPAAVNQMVKEVTGLI